MMSHWTRYEDKLFEQALVMFPEETADRWEKIAEVVPGKSPAEVKQHYEILLNDVYEIDAGRVQIPSYAENSPTWDSGNQISFTKSKHHGGGETERKKGAPWTEDEHKAFLKGLEIFGKGDWRSISRHAVVTRTPTQVASHAQKFYNRQNSAKKERKRSSIHDITRVDSIPIDVPPPVEQNWVSQPSGGGSVQQVFPPLQQLHHGSQFPNLGGYHQNYGYRL